MNTLTESVEKKIKHIDAFIGNPPWLAKREKLFNEDELTYINENYRSAKGFKKNLFSLFVERVCQISSSSTHVNLVVPNRLMDTPSYKDTRQVFMETFSSVDICKLPEGSFKDVTASYISLHLHNEKNGINVYSCDEECRETNFLYAVPTPDLESDCKVNLNRKVEDIAFAEKLKSVSFETKELFFCHVGMMVKNNKEEFKEVKSKKYNKPIVKGRCLGVVDVEKTYYFNPDEVTVFGGTKRPEKHEAMPKLLVRKTGDYILSSIDEDNGIYAEQSVYLVIPRESMDIDIIRAVNLYFNTSIPTRYFRSELITNPDSYPYIQQYDLEQIPIPRALVDDKKMIGKILSLFNDDNVDDSLKKIETYIYDKLGFEESSDMNIAA